MRSVEIQIITTQGDTGMNQYNTILGQILDPVSRKGFERLVKKHKTEFGAKGLRSWTQFVAMVFGQLSGQHGLRSIEQAMNSQQNIWYHLGLDPEGRGVKRSSLSYANRNRDAGLFEELFYQLVGQAQKDPEGNGFRFKNPLYSIDATTIDLCMKLFPWADFREKKGGIKLTIKLDHQGKIPCFAVVSNGKEHESKKAREIPFEAGDIVTFDRGYSDFGYFRGLNEQKVWFVTRLKNNIKYRRKGKKRETKGENILSDIEIIIPRVSETRHLRKIIAKDPETGKRVVLLTNNLKWSAGTVADIYRDRWQIELFFKAIKQNLKIKRFYGNTKNAVMTQIWIALIVYLLVYLLKVKAKTMQVSFTNFVSVIKTMLFQRRSLFEWLWGSSPPLKPARAVTGGQLEFAL
jgi:putative transposase